MTCQRVFPRSPDGFDLLNAGEFVVVQDLVKVNDDLVEQPDALHALVDVLRVEVGEEVGDGGEEDAGVAAALGVQLLRERTKIDRRKVTYSNSIYSIPQIYLPPIYSAHATRLPTVRHPSSS